MANKKVEEQTKYPEVTPEQRKAILAVFGGYGDQDIKISVHKDGYHIATEQMYSYVPFANDMSVLQAYMELAKILNCKDGDEQDRYFSGGCETCDYGSSYQYTLRFW